MISKIKIQYCVSHGQYLDSYSRAACNDGVLFASQETANILLHSRNALKDCQDVTGINPPLKSAKILR